jgi:sugar phosphate permease
LAGIAGLFASLGLGRFSLGMMLPSMGEALSLSYSQMGLISTINFCGYLIAVLLCGVFTTRFGPRDLISVALVLVSCSMILIGLSTHYLLILLLYFFPLWRDIFSLWLYLRYLRNLFCNRSCTGTWSQ